MRIVLLILVLPLGAALAVAAGGRFSNWIDPVPVVTGKPSAPLSPLYIADGKDDLGEVWETNDAVLTVPISNRTDKDIEILDFETSCDCGEIIPRQLVVPAHGTAEVKVKMDLTKKTSQQTAMRKRKTTLQFKPILSAKSEQSRMSIYLIARAAANVDVSPIDFDDWCKHNGKTISRHIKCKVYAPDCKVSCQSDSATVSTIYLRDADGEAYISVTPSSTSPIGKFDGRITVSVVAGDGSLAKYSIPYSGTIVLQNGEMK